MSTVRLGGVTVSEASFNRAREIVNNKPRTGKMSTNDVLESLRQMMPGWTISTSSNDWGEGFRNIEICHDILREMAEDPSAMKKYKALLLDFEDAVPALEEWSLQNEGQSIQFGISIDSAGNISSLAVIRTLMGAETRTVFDLPDGKSSWTEVIMQKLGALNSGQADGADSSVSWIA
jgi:hypothetical protein